MTKLICQIAEHKKTVLETISLFCAEMFDDERELDPLSLVGNAFSSNGLLFALKDGVNTYKIIYRNGMGVFEFFTDVLPDR